MEQEDNSIEDMDLDDSASTHNSSFGPGPLDTSITLLSEKDSGLFLLVPLYKLLRGNCAQTIFKIFVTKFERCEFFSKKDSRSHSEKNLYDFLTAINTIGSDKQKEMNKSKANQEKDKSKTNQEKDKSKTNQEKISWQIHNLDDNKEILQTVTVRNMLDADEEKCKPLKNLDLNFLINIVTNAILQYPLSKNANISLNQIKDIRHALYHAKYNFSREDFHKNLEMLQENLKEIYNNFGIPQHILDMDIELCRIDVTDPIPPIFSDLQKEIHEKYKSPQSFICPMIRKASGGEESSVKRLENYLCDHNSKPILLCGKRGSGKTSILQNQAYQLVQKLNDAQYQGGQPQFSLVILFEENPLGPLTEENFWETVTGSIWDLAPIAAARYGIETLLVVIKMHIKEIIFFLNWNLQDITTQFKETSDGTWVFTYQGHPEESADWNILITEPLSDTEVNQLLKSLNPDPHELEIIYEKYRVCNYKKILTTPDMVKIFNELIMESILGTEFELMIKYVEKKMREGYLSNETVRAVGKLAFYGIIKNELQFSIDEVEKNIDEPGQLAFFTKNKKYFVFIHSTLIYFLASVYVIEDLNNACKEWLDNTLIFKRVFKFACSFWFQDVDHCWKKSIRRNGSKKDYLKRMEDFLCKFLSVDKMHSSTMEVDENNPDNNTNDGMNIEVSEREETENPFTKWGFLFHIDEACDGVSDVLKMLADILSYIKCWIFYPMDDFDLKMKRVQKILKKVKLNQSFPVVIKIESGQNFDMLMNIWKILKNTESLYNAVRVRISIMPDKKEGKYQNLDNRQLENLSRVIVDACAPVYITDLSMPIICPKIPDFKFSIRECIQKLEYLDVIVYDVNSLRDVLNCGSLPNMKSIKIYVDLNISEQRINNHLQLKVPKNINVNLTIVYFKEIQNLLNAFTCRHRLLSLSIRGLVVVEGFKLDISAFKNMESIYLHCDMNDNISLKFNCAHLLSMNLILPKHLERLLLSKVQFYNDTNVNLFTNFFEKYNIQKLMILDSNVSLDGARRSLKQHMFQEKGFVFFIFRN